MNEQYRNYAIFLDELRIDAKLTVFEFCDEVCHDRTYRKYLSGESSMSHKVLYGLCKKLGFTIEEFFFVYDKRVSIEYLEVDKLFFYINDNKKQEAKKLLIKLDNYEFKNFMAEKLFKYCLVSYSQMFKTDTLANIYSRYSKMIDYPNCLEKTHYDIIDALCLHKISIIEVDNKEYKALTAIHNLLMSNDKIFVTDSSRKILPSLYSVVVRGYGIMNELDKALEVCNVGIDYTIKVGTVRDLHNLYYYQSLCYFKTGYKAKAFDSARKCLYTLEIMNKMDDYELYSNVMEKDFGVEIKEVLKNR